MNQETRYYFSIPFDEKGLFKREFGGRWDKSTYSWYTLSSTQADAALTFWKKKEI